jgi:hypothetical protein
MDRDTKFAVLAMGLPLFGLLYCGIIIAVLANVAEARAHPLLAGLIFAALPFSVSATYWLRNAARNYQPKTPKQ